MKRPPVGHFWKLHSLSLHFWEWRCERGLYSSLIRCYHYSSLQRQLCFSTRGASAGECETDLANGHRTITNKSPSDCLYDVVSRHSSPFLSGWRLHCACPHNLCQSSSRGSLS